MRNCREMQEDIYNSFCEGRGTYFFRRIVITGRSVYTWVYTRRKKTVSDWNGTNLRVFWDCLRSAPGPRIRGAQAPRLRPLAPPPRASLRGRARAGTPDGVGGGADARTRGRVRSPEPASVAAPLVRGPRFPSKKVAKLKPFVSACNSGEHTRPRVLASAPSPTRTFALSKPRISRIGTDETYPCSFV